MLKQLTCSLKLNLKKIPDEGFRLSEGVTDWSCTVVVGGVQSVACGEGVLNSLTVVGWERLVASVTGLFVRSS